MQVEEKRRAIAEAEAFKHPFKPQLATDIGRRSPSPSSSSSPHNNVEDPYFYAYASGSSNGGRVRRKSLSERTAEHVAKQQEKLFYGEVIEIRRRTRGQSKGERACGAHRRTFRTMLHIFTFHCAILHHSFCLAALTLFSSYQQDVPDPDPFEPQPFAPVRASLATAQGRELDARAEANAMHRPLYPNPQQAAAKEKQRLAKKAQLEVRILFYFFTCVGLLLLHCKVPTSTSVYLLCVCVCFERVLVATYQHFMSCLAACFPLCVLSLFQCSWIRSVLLPRTSLRLARKAAGSRRALRLSSTREVAVLVA